MHIIITLLYQKYSQDLYEMIMWESE